MITIYFEYAFAFVGNQATAKLDVNNVANSVLLNNKIGFLTRHREKLTKRLALIVRGFEVERLLLWQYLNRT